MINFHLPKKYKYTSTHEWVSRHFGKADHCENVDCKSDGKKKFEWSNISHEYKRERNDWVMLCQPCHRMKDYGDYCKRGHLLAGDNLMHVRSRPNWRICKICQKLYSKNWKDSHCV